MVFDLEPGETTLGSSRSNTVVLTGTGVSRRHARVLLSPDPVLEGQDPEVEWPTVEDLGSKNGIALDGRVVTRGSWHEGVELGLGSARLRLERVEPEDATLGLVLDPPADPSAPDSATSLPRLDDTTLLPESGALPGSLLRLLENLAERLTLRPRPDFDGVLTSLGRGLGGRGVALVEWPRSGPPVVELAVGGVGPLPARRPKATAVPVPWLIDEPEPLVAAVREGAGGVVRGLVVWGDFALRRASVPLLGIALRWIDHVRPEALAAIQPGGGAAESARLKFPRHIVRGEAPAMVSLYQQLESLSEADLPILLTGETGVGKEHLARLLHQASTRREQPFVALNCAAIPDDLLEAEMFGIGRGVATGVQPRKGKFAQAHRGTLFLDEIGELAPALQAKLLRAIQEQEIQPLGEPARAVDVRLVSATNCDLEHQIDAGGFRRDLYYRLAGEVLRVPPLRQRREDLPRLVGHFLRRSSQRLGKPIQGLTVKALRALSNHHWPGNVRELEHEVRRLVHRCPEGGAIDFGMLSASVVEAPSHGIEAAPEAPVDDFDLAGRFEALERELIPRALARARGNQTAAARLLGISRNGLAKRLKRLGIRPDDPWR